MFCRNWLLRREEFGQYQEELRKEDMAAFKNFLRVDCLLFHELVDRLTPRITKMVIWFQKALPPGLKVAVMSGTLPLATATTPTWSKKICDGIVAVYSKEVLNTPLPQTSGKVEQNPSTHYGNFHMLSAHWTGSMWPFDNQRRPNSCTSTTRGTIPSSL